MPKVFVNLLQTTGTKGGIEVYVRELYREIGRLETGFEFVGYASSELAQTDVRTWFPGDVVDSGISGENRISWAWGELFRVSAAAKRAHADLIHGPAMFGPLHSAMPTVITMHDLSYFTHPDFMKTKIFTAPVKWMEKRGVANATRVIASSQATANEMARYLTFPSNRTDVVLLAGRPSEVLPTAPEKRVHDLFVAMGQRSPYKSFETVLGAWKMMPPRDRPRLVITGSHGNDPLVSLVRDLELADSVELKGWISDDELVKLLTTATALIEPTIAAGFGMPALEAMQQGLPVIISDIPVFREIAGPSAEYFAPAAPLDLVRAVTFVSSDTSRRLAMSTSGLKWAASYSWQKCAEETLDSFRLALRDYAS
jgi:glycosyltransferase involved in cell wall biosynthesis